MNDKPVLKAVFLAVTGAVLVVFSAPPYTIGKFLVWFALVLFWWGLFSLPSSRSRILWPFLYGWVFGVVYHAGVLNWLLGTWTAWYGQSIFSVTKGALVSFAIDNLGAVYIGIVSVLCSWAARQARSKSGWLLPCLLPFLCGAVWVCGEYVTAFILGGLTWTNLGYMVWDSLSLVQTASYSGVYGLTFLVAAVPASLGILLAGRGNSFGGRGAVYGTVLSCVLLAGVYVHGRGVLSANPPQGLRDGPISVAVMHSDMRLEKQFDPGFGAYRYEIYERLAGEVKGGPAVTFWPETSLPIFSKNDSPEKIERVNRLLSKTGSINIFGARTRVGERIYASAVNAGRDHSMTSVYRKLRPMYFAETSPYAGFSEGNFLGRFLKPAPDDVTPGTEFTLHPVVYGRSPSGEPLKADFGLTLCWEQAFPYIPRGLTKNGAQVLGSLTEGMWFLDRTRGKFQNVVMNRYRCAENRRMLVMSGNVHYSGLVDPFGRFLELKGPGGEAVIYMGLTPRSEKTFYTRFGDVFVLGCGAFSFLWFVFFLPPLRGRRVASATTLVL